MNENINYWLVPNNPAKYDAIKAFKELNVFDWGNGGDNKIEIGDIIYIYTSKPIQAITIKAKVIKIDIDEKNLLNNDKSYYYFNNTDVEKKYFRLELLNFTNIENLTLDKLKDNGLKSPPQGKQKLKDEILKYIRNYDLNQSGENNNMKINPLLNQILFGPPGTGKTFNTINKALEIIDSDFFQANKDDRKALKEKFEEYKKAGQIEFVTFHQSYGYEEFVEGIKAIPVGKEGNEDGNEMIYAISDGIFKKLSKKSLEEFISINTSSKINKKRFVLNAKSLNIQAELIQEDEDNFRVLKGSKMRKGYATSFEQYNYFKLRKEVEENAKLKEESEFFIFEEDYSFQSLSAASSVILGRMSNGTIDWKEIFENIIVDKNQDIKNYILIIDEINRGNISKIFGELITLIEPSKRIGADEEIKLKLPYSNDEFGVPLNLYILGTMNTADRSIALMDTALRRRFEFIEMLPDLEVLKDIKVKQIEIYKLLETINKRVEYLYDRDHTIGHAYFMSLKDNPTLEELENIFRNKIIPLLQEYFYDDWEKIRLVLADNQKDEEYQFIKIKKDYDVNSLFGKDIEIDLDDEQKIYEIDKEAFGKIESYVKIYK